MKHKIFQNANIEANLNVFLYLIGKIRFEGDKTLKSLIFNLYHEINKNDSLQLKYRDIYRLRILKNAVTQNQFLADTILSHVTYSPVGLTACVFIKPDESISIVFRGTGNGEWSDNGRGLSGIPCENTYINYTLNGTELFKYTVSDDFATGNQVETLNWFNYIASLYNFNENTHITVSGHSKGGNKAQFIAVNSDLVCECYSFCGQGFSSEALNMFINKYNHNYYIRQNKIYSFSSENDYVNVLGTQLVTKENRFYFESRSGFHYMEAILDENGQFLPQSQQGPLSKYIESVSEDLMNLNPYIRQYATLGIMNIFQKYIGNEKISEENSLSLEETIQGIAIAITALFNNIHKLADTQTFPN